MGVMSCSRRGCDNIMCDTYVKSVGYICGGCKSEFKEYLENKGLEPNTERAINKELELFMVTEKDSYENDKDVSVDDFFYERSR